MSTAPKIPLDNLKIPTYKSLVCSKPRRTSSFIDKPNQADDFIASNLSLSTAGNSILKQPNSPSRRPSTSSRLSVHYTPMTMETEDEVDLGPSLHVPRMENSPLRKNPRRDNQQHHFFQIPTHYGQRGLLQYPNWLHAFSQKRSNDENSDAYTIFSILYGLVIFIGGVTLSISHAIIPAEEAENIKVLAEIYFTYLYWISICWIIFCILDIVRHRRRLNINNTIIKKFDTNHLPPSSGHLGFPTNKQFSPPSNEQMPKSPSTPYFNLQLFDDSDEFHSDDNLNEKTNERHGISSTKRTVEDADNDDENLRYTRSKSQSLDNLSTKSSVNMRRNVNSTRDVLTRRHALDPGDAHNLRSYVRHRKDSIVQRVIGYNYDDHSTAGGLYIRVGIGIFCLGTVIHSGLSILSNLEYFLCARWTAVMDDFSRLLFSFTQFFFIFKHSNLIIRAHESLARLAVMHVVVTNLCVWFRMVVIETKSQIFEAGAHELAIAQLIGSSPMNGSHSPINPSYRSSIHSHECLQSIEDAQQMTAVVNEGYMRLKPLLYPCTIEFSLMCLTLFYLIWENIGKTFAHKISDKASTKNVFMVNCHASIKGLFAGMIVFSTTVISIILYAVFRNKIGDEMHLVPSLIRHPDASQHNRIHSRAAIITSTLVNRHSLIIPSSTLLNRPSLIIPSSSSAHNLFRSTPKTPTLILHSIAIVEIVNLCLLIISLLATIWALIKIRKLQYKRTTTRFDDVLIVVSLTGIYLYSIFSAFALLNNKHHSTWLAYLKIVIVVLEFIEGTVHAFFILVALRKRLTRANKNQYPAREIITLLIMLDLSLWFEETTTTTKHEANPFQLAFYHTIPWSIIAAIATPLQIFFRFHASVCLSHVWENMYILPAYEPVAPHGL